MMKKFLKLGRLFPLFTLLTACPDDFTPSDEVETQDAQINEETKEEVKEETTSEKENTEEVKEEKEEETKEEGGSGTNPFNRDEEPPYQPNFRKYEYTSPLEGADLVDENTPTTEPSSSTTEEKPVITSTGFKAFHDKALEIHKTNINNFKVHKEIYYQSAKSTISGTVLLDEGYVTKNVTSNWYYLGAGDVFKLYEGVNESLNTTDPDKSFYPDTFRTANIPNTNDMRLKEKYWNEEYERVEKANEGWTVNKYMYFYINTRAANLNEIINAPYYSSLTGGKNYKFEYSTDNNGLYATRTTDNGKTSYSFDNRGRMTKVVIKSNTAGQEDVTVNITYSNVVIN